MKAKYFKLYEKQNPVKLYFTGFCIGSQTQKLELTFSKGPLFRLIEPLPL